MPSQLAFHPIQIGDRVRDPITNLSGIVTNVSRWLHGSIRIGVQPEALHEGRPVPEQYFDQMRLVVSCQGVHAPMVQTLVADDAARVGPIDLGDRVKDPITGLSGIVTCHTTRLHGCVRFGVQPEQTHDGSPVEDKYFDATQLVVLEKRVHRPVALEVAPAPPADTRHSSGGPEREGRGFAR